MDLVDLLGLYNNMDVALEDLMGKGTSTSSMAFVYKFGIPLLQYSLYNSNHVLTSLISLKRFGIKKSYAYSIILLTKVVRDNMSLVLIKISNLLFCFPLFLLFSNSSAT